MNDHTYTFSGEAANALTFHLVCSTEWTIHTLENEFSFIKDKHSKYVLLNHATALMRVLTEMHNHPGEDRDDLAVLAADLICAFQDATAMLNRPAPQRRTQKGHR